MGKMRIPPDFADLLAAFADAEVKYLVIGGYAVGLHDRPRTTKDLDLFLEPTNENLQRAARALGEFGAPRSVVDDLVGAAPDEIVWWGNPPLRIDFLQAVPGLDFASAFQRRSEVEVNGIRIHVVGLTDLIEAKRAAGRPQDLVDAERLEKRRKGGATR